MQAAWHDDDDAKDIIAKLWSPIIYSTKIYLSNHFKQVSTLYLVVIVMEIQDS